MPDLDEIIRLAIEDRLLDVHTSFLGKVVSVDGTTCSVQPLTRRPVPATDGGFKYEQIPTIPYAVLLSFGTNAAALEPTVAAGDYVWCLCSESDISQALDSGSEVDPAQVARFGLSCPLAIPVCLPGHTTATDFVALASKVAANWTAFKNAVQAWTPVPNDGGASLKAVIAGLTVENTASAGLRAK